MTPWTIVYQAPLSMGFSRQQYWSGLPFPSPGDRPDPGIKPGSSALQVDAFFFLNSLSYSGSPISLKRNATFLRTLLGTVTC